MRYDTVYLTCGIKLTGSQFSPPDGTNKKLKCETKNKMIERDRVKIKGVLQGGGHGER